MHRLRFTCLLLSYFSKMRLRVNCIFCSYNLKLWILWYLAGLLSAIFTHKNNRERGSQRYSSIINCNCNMLSVDVFFVSTNLLRGDNNIVFYSGKSVFISARFTSEMHHYQESAGSSVNCIRSLFTMQLVIEHLTYLTSLWINWLGLFFSQKFYWT